MESEIIVAIISGLITLIGVLIQVHQSHDKIVSEVEKRQAVTDTKIDNLTREVRKHNNFAERIPVLEEQLKVANHRISDLEGETK